MKKRKGHYVSLAVQKEIGRGKFKPELFAEAIRHNSLRHDIFKSNKKIMKHEAIVRAFHNNWDANKVLCLWGKATSTNSLTPIAALPGEVDCVLLYEVTFDRLVRMIVQVHNLKAFL